MSATVADQRPALSSSFSQSRVQRKARNGVHRDHDDDWKRPGLVDDYHYGQKLELSAAQFYRLAEIVRSEGFSLITGLWMPSI